MTIDRYQDGYQDGESNIEADETFARHQSPRTTAGYTRTTRQRLRETVDALDYLR